MNAPLALAGKAILVTGAGQGLGRAYAVQAAQAGASVTVNDINEATARSVAEEIRDAGGAAIAVAGSVSSWSDSERAVQETVRAFGALDGVVANAAIMHMGKPWEEDEVRLRRIVEVNVLGVQFSVGHALRAMVEAGTGGSIVNVVSGAQHGVAGMSAYGATKGAVNAMTVNWAIEGKEHGIRVNAVSPWALTQMTIDHLDQSHADPESFPTADAIAPLVLSLLSDATSTVTGQILRFDGRRVSRYGTDLTVLGEQPEWSTAELSALLLAGGS
ncbi:MAG: SDR family NAD(P)-dependent oxidoreductase [Nocardioidaceae bacterium]